MNPVAETIEAPLATQHESATSPKRIGILAHVGNKNLGDEATVTATIQNIRRRYPNAEILAFTSNPEDTIVRHGVPAVPSRRIEPRRGVKRKACLGKNDSVSTRGDDTWQRLKIWLKGYSRLFSWLKAIQAMVFIARNCVAEVAFIARGYQQLRGLDLLLITGSQQLNDYNGGPWAFPYTLFKWSLLARLTGTKVAFLSVGVGPLRSRTGRLLAQRALNLAAYHSFRGRASKRFVEKLGVSGQPVASTDLVYSLRLEAADNSARDKASTRVVAINALPYFDERYWPESNSQVYSRYVSQMANFALWLLNRGYSIVFFPTQLRADPWAIADIREELERLWKGKASSKAKLLDWPTQSIEDLVATISAADFVVATRFHGIVIPFALGKPVLGIAYHSKSTDVMEQMGQRRYALDVNELNLPLLQERFAQLEAEGPSIQREIAGRLATVREDLDQQYDKVFRFLD